MLVKAGYGTLEEVRKMDARTVLQALNFEKFESDYSRAYIEMRRKEQ